MDLTQEQAFKKKSSQLRFALSLTLNIWAHFIISISRYELSLKENVQKITKEQH